jgi:hypothetical protein
VGRLKQDRWTDADAKTHNKGGDGAKEGEEKAAGTSPEDQKEEEGELKEALSF